MSRLRAQPAGCSIRWPSKKPVQRKKKGTAKRDILSKSGPKAGGSESAGRVWMATTSRAMTNFPTFKAAFW